MAAQHFAWLTLGVPLDRGMFETPLQKLDVDQLSDAAVRVFLAAYGPRSS